MNEATSLITFTSGLLNSLFFGILSLMNAEAIPAPLLPYPSDLTDEQWAEVEPMFEHKQTPKANGQAGGAGRPYSTTMRQIVNGVLYQAFTGIPWRFLPRDIHPVYQTIYAYHMAWERDGTLKSLYGRLNIVPPTNTRKARARMPRAGVPLPRTSIRAVPAAAGKGR